MEYLFKVISSNGELIFEVSNPTSYAVIYQHRYPSYTEHAVTGDMIADPTLIELETMKDSHDINGMEAFLKQKGLINQDDTLISSTDHASKVKKEQHELYLGQAIQKLKDKKDSFGSITQTMIDTDAEGFVKFIAEQYQNRPMNVVNEVQLLEAKKRIKKLFGEDIVDLAVKAFPKDGYEQGGAITQTTPILAELIADQVASQAVMNLPALKKFPMNRKASIAMRLTDYLSDKANALYKKSDPFRDVVSGKDGRGMLAAYMSQWAKSWAEKGGWTFEKGGQLAELKKKRLNSYFNKDYQAIDEYDRQIAEKVAAQIRSNPEKFKEVFENPDVTILYISPENTLSSQLTRLTGDSYNMIDFDGNAATGEVLIHKATGKKFTALNDVGYHALFDTLGKNKKSLSSFARGGSIGVKSINAGQVDDMIQSLDKKYLNG